jgi:hypothetical protein
MLAAPVAAMVVHWLFVYVIPAKCPACRLLVWQMGIWLESDGWRPRAVLLASYDVANPPDPQLLVWVAYDLAKRIGDLPTCSTRPVVLVHEKLVSALEF